VSDVSEATDDTETLPTEEQLANLSRSLCDDTVTSWPAAREQANTKLVLKSTGQVRW